MQASVQAGAGESSIHGGCARVSMRSFVHLVDEKVVDEFHIRYTTQGVHALVDVSDTNGNGTPDVIDDLITQLVAARDYYSGPLALIHPLLQPRYSQARRIDVYVQSMQRGNGLAYDEVVRLGSNEAACSLRMVISRDLKPSGNLTPAHELFHLYQYGYAMFKRSWYLEGMARMIEAAFAGPDRLLVYGSTYEGADACKQAWGRSYAAAYFWWFLAASADVRPTVLPENMRNLRYLGGGPVFLKESFPMGDLMKPILTSLGKASDVESEILGLPRYKWPEKIQRSEQFDTVICDVVKTVTQTH